MPRQEFVSTRTLLEKLGIRARARVLLVGVSDDDFIAELDGIEARVDSERGRGPYDAIFYRVASPGDLDLMPGMSGLLTHEGALWLLRRKGKERTLSEGQTMAAGKAAGLVDVKVVNFSPDESAEKFVIPLELREAKTGGRRRASPSS